MDIGIITPRYILPVVFSLVIAGILFMAQRMFPMTDSYGAGVGIIGAILLFAVMAKFWALSKDDKLVLNELKAQKAVSKRAKLS
jgi:hypothetical protein